MIQFEKMFIEQSLFDEREAAKEAGLSRRPRGSSKPELLFTGTPHGSFGLEFVPVFSADSTVQLDRSKSLGTVTDSIARVAAAGNDNIDRVISSIPSSVLTPMKNFFKIIARNEAELRLANPNNPPASFNTDQLKHAYERLEREVHEVEIQITGIFRGLTMQTGHFDLLTNTGEVLTGTISEEMTEMERLNIYSKIDQKCELTLLETTVKTISGPPNISYVLLRAK